MRLILNESTNTVHRARHDTGDQVADCGALRHVTHREVHPLEEADLESESADERAINRCGRCFDGYGGY
ncbi:hypothetical protein G6M89_19595 [Natronolimnobius sp. AArcel1]|uniref:hypothetical protein n=1 Tax=Natronolimnobius sp. AArcel1 TaxID=1679093 RepID=UPI0013ED9E46|nr:hypothetical protein [Natronolimnobius sp. AArcel1]NGM71181.1 hypothetical protein [Natronolimnobius sp. AArcel1]